MFDFSRDERIKKYTENVQEYLRLQFKEPVAEDEHTQSGEAGKSAAPWAAAKFSERSPVEESEVKFSERTPSKEQPAIKFSERTPPEGDHYTPGAIRNAIRSTTQGYKFDQIQHSLSAALNRTFVDCVIQYINERGLRDSSVYKAANIDRRLFSKMMSNRNYKPSKDTAVAIAFALHLTLFQAIDLLSRAGYVLSHSSKRDVIIEYFFREGVYQLTDINEVLDNLGEKIIGR